MRNEKYIGGRCIYRIGYSVTFPLPKIFCRANI